MYACNFNSRSPCNIVLPKPIFSIHKDMLRVTKLFLLQPKHPYLSLLQICANYFHVLSSEVALETFWLCPPDCSTEKISLHHFDNRNDFVNTSWMYFTGQRSHSNIDLHLRLDYNLFSASPSPWHVISYNETVNQ